jgi:hypothetical protein
VCRSIWFKHQLKVLLTVTSKYLKQWGVVVFGVFFGGAAAADPLFDFTLFSPPEVSQRRLQEPEVSWLVKPNASSFCQQAQPKDGFVSRPEGCVYWQLQASRCTIVTTGQTTHSLLGHLFVHCLQAR